MPRLNLSLGACQPSTATLVAVSIHVAANPYGSFRRADKLIESMTTGRKKR